MITISEIKWRDDGFCGSDYRLHNNEPAECDPEGENPCCGPKSRCGNTAEYCDCEECQDFRDWKDSEGAQKWRLDRKCGRNYPLPDGSPSECDPDSENPCCDEDGRCNNKFRLDKCLCPDCVDYRLIRAVRESGESCALTKIVQTGYLKYVCFDEIKQQQYFKCTNSDEFYQADFDEYNSVSQVCSRDLFSYQACGFGKEVSSNTDHILCGGYICEQRKLFGRFGWERWLDFWWGYEYIECSGNGCRSDKRDCSRNLITESLTCDNNLP